MSDRGRSELQAEKTSGQPGRFPGLLSILVIGNERAVQIVREREPVVRVKPHVLNEVPMPHAIRLGKSIDTHTIGWARADKLDLPQRVAPRDALGRSGRPSAQSRARPLTASCGRYHGRERAERTRTRSSIECRSSPPGRARRGVPAAEALSPHSPAKRTRPHLH